MRPQLAEDWVEEKQRFPVMVLPKIDGVRGLNEDGDMYQRSMKPVRNLYTRKFFGGYELRGFDGEMAAEHECHPDLCRLTTSATATIAGEPWVMWWIFDHWAPGTYSEHMGYKDRHALAAQMIRNGQAQGLPGYERMRIVEATMCYNMQEVLALEEKYLLMGYEGIILRDPNGKYKQGRSTVREGLYLRGKRFVDFEGVITELYEGEENTNEQTQNELGLATRSTHQENMVPNGMIGAMNMRLLKDVINPVTKVLLFKKDGIVKVGAGRMTHDDRAHYFANPHLILGKLGKGQLFPQGVKDKPRFPTFQCFRNPEDL